MIRRNAHKYSISAQCKVLNVNRATYYYAAQWNEATVQKDLIETEVLRIFNVNEKVYGTRKIKVELKKAGYIVSRRRIGRIMKEHGLVSAYTIAQFKVHKSTCNEAATPNLLNRKFNPEVPFKAVVSDLTYVRVDGKWNYICLLTDLFNREIIGYSCGRHKDAALVYQAFAKVKANLKQIQLFHTDRGNEFKNRLIDEVMDTFEIKRSLSMKGCPYDNAVAEATFKLVKTEFVKPRHFSSLAQLDSELKAYVTWFNLKRIHSTLGYLSPIEYKNMALIKTV